MSRIHLTATATFCIVACFALGGRAETPPPSQSARTPPVEDYRRGEVAIEDGSRRETTVACRATLAAVEREHAWFSDSSAGHDDGIGVRHRFHDDK